MQGPLTFAQEQKLEMLKNVPFDGKALAHDYEHKARHMGA